MSHTTKIDTVPVKDIEAVKSAVSELKQQGINIELLTNVNPRMYYKNQHGNCDFVLNLKDSVYDVGLNAVKDSNGYIDHYEYVFDEHANYVGKVLGIPSQAGADPILAQLAKFTSLYSKHAAINSARNQGFNVRDIHVDAKGNTQLVFAMM